MSELAPYRLPVVQPVCAKCKHRCDAKMMDPDEPWRDWFCLVTSKELWHEEYNPITGVTTPAKMGHERCINVNIEGDCTRFEEATEDEPRPIPPKHDTPTLSWWRRILRGRR